MARFWIASLLLWLPLVHSSGLQPLVIMGASMEPTLRAGQMVLLHRNYYRTHPLRRGDVVVFRARGKLYVKRVYALAGEPVHLVCNSGYCDPVEGRVEQKARRLAGNKPGRFHVRSLVVSPGCFYGLGDCLPGSVDSRELGPIPVSAILGRVQSVWSRNGLAPPVYATLPLPAR